MSVIRDLKRQIITRLSALTDFNKVYSYERLNPQGFPAAFVTFQGTDNEFFTNAENKRVYQYRVLILFQIGNLPLEDTSSNVLEEAEEAVQDLVQEAVDAIDSDYTFSNDAEMIFVEAAIGELGYVEWEGGIARSAEVTLRIHSVYVV